MLGRIRRCYRLPASSLATARRRPQILFYAARTARVPLAVLLLTVLFLTLVMPPSVDALLGKMFPDQNFMQKLGSLFGGSGRDAQRDLATQWLLTLAWTVGIGYVLTLFWRDLPSGIARAKNCSQMKEKLAAKIQQRSPQDGLRLYVSALRLASEEKRIEEIQKSIRAIQLQQQNASDDDAIGGRYRILEAISRGGNGVVYRAMDLTLERVVALKQLAVGVVSDEEGARFHQEARALARLNHANIVQVYDLLEHRGRTWIAMEFVEGGNLSDRIIERGRLDSAEVIRISGAIADAMECAHGHGIIHRDLKAMNVLLTASAEPRVADFGTAKLTSSSVHTMEGSIMGTPHSISPEQARGDPVDERSDVYSLGILMYQMLLGRPPFTGELMAVLNKHLNESPPSVDGQEDSPEMPKQLAALTMQMLAKDPTDRPDNMRVIRDALEQIAAVPA